MKITVIGLDLAKNVIQVCVLSEHGKVVRNAKLAPKKVSELLANTPPTLVAMEACGSAHFWGRLAQQHGHTVRLLPAQHVKAFRRVHKSDSHDALAIVEAAQRPNLHAVPVKTIAQQDMGILVRLREQLVTERTAKANQIRGFGREFGLHFSKTISALLVELKSLSTTADNYSPRTCVVLAELALDVVALNQRIDKVSADLAEMARAHPAYARLQKIPGIGPVIAVTLIAKAGNGAQFANGRQMAAWLGLVPRQNGTGGANTLGSITKSGDRALRRQLIHGARTVVRWLDKQDVLLRSWIDGISKRRGRKRAIVAYANKLARLAYRALVSEQDFALPRAFGPQR